MIANIVNNMNQTFTPSEYRNSGNLTSARLRINPPGYSNTRGAFVNPNLSAAGEKVRAPDIALDALGRLHVHQVNSFRAATNSRNFLNDSSPTKHLVMHVSRVVVHPAGRTTNAALQASQQVSSTQPYTFNQRITMLMNAPAVLNALGLVLRFRFDRQYAAGLQQVSLDPNCPAIQQLIMYGQPQLRSTYCTDAFLPKPNNSGQITNEGWMAAANGYHAGSLQIDSAAMHIVGFANQAGVRQIAATGQSATIAPPPVTVSRDEDVVHPILPPSPHTGGFYVWKDNLQGEVAAQRDQLPTGTLYAEDLQNGVVVDLLPATENPLDADKWIRLCLRNKETYSIHSVEVQSKDVERGVKVAAVRSVHPGINQQLAHDVDETIFNWRYGSLVNKPGLSSTPMKSKTSGPTRKKQVPWKDVPAPKVETPRDRSPLFGTGYKTSMRASFVTGTVVPFDPAAADRLSLPASPFLRYELMQGPALIPVATEHYLGKDDQSSTRLFVGSTIDASNGSAKVFSRLSQRLIVPARVTSEVARRHGKSEAEINRGATTVLLTDKGDLPSQIPYAGGGPAADAPAYLPDPLVIGVWAILADLKTGYVITYKDLDFYQNDFRWPNYTAHFVELHAALSGAPSLEIGDFERFIGSDAIANAYSQAFKCHLPLGETCLLVLRPKLDPLVWTQHALAGLPTVNSDLYELALSDICRPTVARLIHATNLPKVRPVITSTRITETSLSADVTVDPLSTSKVALVASWRESQDDLKQPIFAEPVVQSQLAEVKIGKKDPTNPNTLLATVTLTGQFPFADGGHRHLTVTAVATARYGGVFPNGVKNPNTWGSAPQELDRLATAVPKIPDTECVLPNLRWTINKGKRERRMGLTLVLNRSWFSSGGGEQLAIITAPSEGSAIIDTIGTLFAANAEDKVSAWGVYADWDQAFSQTVSGTRIQIEKQGPPAEGSDVIPFSPGLTAAEQVVLGDNKSYSALLYTPHYNKQDQQWYVNLSLSAPPVYGVVIRLLLARYQKFAATGANLSEPSMCDFALLRPGRAVTLTPTGVLFWKKIRIQIHGIGPTTGPVPGTRIEVRHFRWKIDQPLHFDWEQGSIIAMDEHFDGADVLWQGTVYHPLFGGRIVVQEWEIWPDAEDTTKQRELLVYSDILNL